LYFCGSAAGELNCDFEEGICAASGRMAHIDQTPSSVPAPAIARRNQTPEVRAQANVRI
jgi:hypothetical protein